MTSCRIWSCIRPCIVLVLSRILGILCDLSPAFLYNKLLDSNRQIQFCPPKEFFLRRPVTPLLAELWATHNEYIYQGLQWTFQVRIDPQICRIFLCILQHVLYGAHQPTDIWTIHSFRRKLYCNILQTRFHSNQPAEYRVVLLNRQQTLQFLENCKL